MTGSLQPLEQKFPIANADGTPTLYFIKWAQQRQQDIVASIDPAYLAAHPLQAGTGITLAPSGNLADSPTISADVQVLLDQLSSTRGSVLFRGLNDWQALAPGTAGQFLKTNGAGADPQWDAGGGSGAPWWFSPPTAASLSLASGDATNLALTDDADTGLLIDGGTPVLGDENRIAYRTLTDKTLDWDLIVRQEYIIPAANFSGIGICARDSVSGRMTSFTWRGTNPFLNVINWTNLSTFNATAATFNETTPRPLWFRISHTGGNYVFQISPDGKIWVTLYTVGDTSFLTNRADQVGLVIDYNRGAGHKNISSCGHFSLTGPGV